MQSETIDGQLPLLMASWDDFSKKTHLRVHSKDLQQVCKEVFFGGAMQTFKLAIIDAKGRPIAEQLESLREIGASLSIQGIASKADHELPGRFGEAWRAFAFGLGDELTEPVHQMLRAFFYGGGLGCLKSLISNPQAGGLGTKEELFEKVKAIRDEIAMGLGMPIPGQVGAANDS